MTRFIARVLVLFYVFPFTSFSVSFAQSKPEASGVESRIKRVEQGLLPAVLVKGDPGWSIEERMKHYKVPGLSIAVINNHKIDWARSYGVTDIETRETGHHRDSVSGRFDQQAGSCHGRAEKSRARENRARRKYQQ